MQPRIKVIFILLLLFTAFVFIFVNNPIILWVFVIALAGISLYVAIKRWLEDEKKIDSNDILTIFQAYVGVFILYILQGGLS